MGLPFHDPVLSEKVIQLLVTSVDGVYVDGTLGGGGHTERILMTLSPLGRVIGIDRDADAIAFTRSRLKHFGARALIVHGNTDKLVRILLSAGITGIDGLVLDLGVSSHQIDDGHRGFSFQNDGRIDMRMDRDQDLDGWKIVNTYAPKLLAEIMREYGEERRARRFAKQFVLGRSTGPINTTHELANLIEHATNIRQRKQTLARIFQAIRIAVNDELGSLERILREALVVLRPGARLVVISYQSLEDRIVKRFFQGESKTTIRSSIQLIPDNRREPSLKVLTRKPIRPSEEEISRNPRSRGAKLRAAERV